VKQILFVDDEPKVLDGLRRMLRPLRHEWEMSFAEGGQQALEHLAASPCDVVVTDMRMPGMDGSELLAEVMSRYPATVRIILSGQCDRATVLKAVGTAHQFLTKPMDSQSLKASVARACSLRDQLTGDRFKEMVSRVRAVASVPARHAELLAELASAEGSTERLGEVVAGDVALTAKVLQLTSTSFFGTPQRCSDPRRAVQLFDLDTLRLLASSPEVFHPLEPGRFPNHLWEDLTDHSRQVAAAAREIARCETSDATFLDDAYLAGMLHDIGIFILADFVADDYRSLLAAKREGETLWEAELRICGESHADVGGYLIGLWGLPDPVVQAVALHHCPQKASPAAFSPLVAVHVANALVGDVFSDLGGTSGPVDQKYLDSIGLAERLPVWAEACREFHSEYIRP
jgi:HD-like signal output (HDOD) protein/CheY-like chemotaxis protein